MPTKNPRINVVLDTVMYQNIQYLAAKEGVSLSNKVRDLIREALEIQEDIYLASFAEERDNTLDISSSLSHEDIWS
jgi:predicted DNA-binding protein